MISHWVGEFGDKFEIVPLVHFQKKKKKKKKKEKKNFVAPH